MTEHLVTQRVTVTCSEGHRLARLVSGAGTRAGFGPVCGKTGSARAWLTPDRLRLVFACDACRAAGRTGRGQVRTTPLAYLLAALGIYGPAHVSVRASNVAIRAALARVIPDEEAEPARQRRRARSERLSRELLAPPAPGLSPAAVQTRVERLLADLD